MGYRRVHGELLVLGLKVAPSTVWEILQEAAIDPAPGRAATTWASFLQSQAQALLACAVAADLLGHARDTRMLRGQMIVLRDKGLAGRERYVADQVNVLLARPDRKDERRRFGNLAGMRQ